MAMNEEWESLAQALAFVGNSVLAPMNQTSTIGIDPDFWREFPDFDDEGIRAAVAQCREFAESAQRDGLQEAATQASVEYTRLFVGPPKPAAAPWESAYRGGTSKGVGFGPAAHEMRALLREDGLELDGPSNQFADHIGIELLYASTLCGKRASGDSAGIADFCRNHPLSWIGNLQSAVAACKPDGYIARILQLAEALLDHAATREAE